MKKNFNVNIAGVIFHMDEDAYEKLENYLVHLRQHFAGTEGREELLADIEGRIAEMLQTRLNENKTVINLADITEVIATLGQPSEWEENAGEMPPQRERPHRLYRDPDSKVIGGVCSGLGSYFNIDVLWIRLAFVLVTLAGFGAGIIAYLLLWFLAPEAKTTAERLEMRGEKVTVRNIERSVREEYESIRGNLSNLKNDARQAYQRSRRSGSNFFEKIFHLFLQVLSVAFRIVVIFFGLLFITLGIFMLTGFLISMFVSGPDVFISSFGISTFSLPAVMRLFLDSPELTLGMTGLVLVIGIPLILLVYMGARLIFRFKSRSRFIGIPAFSLLLAGLVICFIAGMDIVKSFSQRAIHQVNHPVSQPSGNTLVVDVRDLAGEEGLEDMEDRFMIGNWNLVQQGDTTLFFGIPSVDVVRSASDSFSLSVYSIARGENPDQAKARARNIRYGFSQSDSVLTLDPYFYMPLDDKIRGQKVKLLVRIPTGKKVKFAKGTEILHEHQFETEYDLIPGSTWIMMPDGLKEIGRPSVPPAVQPVM